MKTQGIKPREDGCRNWSCTPSGQGQQRLPVVTRSKESDHEIDSPSEPPERTHPADTLILGYWSTEL